MATITTNVHHVVAVAVERLAFDDFHSLRFIFTTADGSTVSVDAFSADLLALADVAEQPAHALRAAATEQVAA